MGFHLSILLHPAVKAAHEKAMSAKPLSTRAKAGIARLLTLQRPHVERPAGIVSSAAGREASSRQLSNARRRVREWLECCGPSMAYFIRRAASNPFNVPVELLLLDLLTDSGTSTTLPSQRALSAGWSCEVPDVHTFAYARSLARDQLNAVVRDVFGERFDFFLALQGRAAEFLLLDALTKTGVLPAGSVILANKPFDTTKGHVQESGNSVISCTPLTTPQAFEQAHTVFLGDIPMDVLKEKFDENSERANAVLLTLTDNGGGGQPVSMKNVKQAAAFAKAHGLLFWIDACRVFENALFIQLFEEGYQEKTLAEIVQEILSHADVATLSFKKMYAHTGGGILVNRQGRLLKGKREEFGEVIKRTTTVLYGCGYDSYCGVTGAGMIEIISGLHVALDSNIIARRIAQSIEAYHSLRQHGFPVVGGAHALYVAADQALPNVALRDCPAEYLQAIVSAALGVRGCGLGNRLYGKWAKKRGGWVLETPAEMDSLRYAFPRETYSTALLTQTLSVLGVAFENGLFKRLHGGLKPEGFDTSGFYHFKAKYTPSNPREFNRTAKELQRLALDLLR